MFCNICNIMSLSFSSHFLLRRFIKKLLKEILFSGYWNYSLNSSDKVKTDNHLQFLGSIGVMLMFCKVNFHVEQSASQIYVYWVYILVIRSPVDSSSWGIFVCGPLQLKFFCYTREKVPSSNSIVGGLTQGGGHWGVPNTAIP